jgi:lipopolysaccharide export system permease protein
LIIGATLGRYFSKRFAKTILVVFGTVFALVYTIDFVELMRRAGDAPGATAAMMAQLALFRTPSVAEQVLPFAVLFGSMATLLQLSRKLELVVARAAGISAWEFLQPGLLVAALLGIASVALYNPLSAALRQQAGVIEARIFDSPSRATGKEIWMRQRSPEGQAVIRAEALIPGTTTLTRVTMFMFDDSGAFTQRVEAREAHLRDGFWDLREARVLTAEEEPRSYGQMMVASSLEPAQLRESFTSPDAVSFWSLDETIERTERAGLDARPYRLHYDILLARPLLFVAMVLVAASVSLRFFRFGGIAKLVLGGVAAGFMLYVATELMEDLGASGLVGTTVAAWFPAVVGVMLGVLALLYQEDG